MGPTGVESEDIDDCIRVFFSMVEIRDSDGFLSVIDKCTREREIADEKELEL